MLEQQGKEARDVHKPINVPKPTSALCIIETSFAPANRKQDHRKPDCQDEHEKMPNSGEKS